MGSKRRVRMRRQLRLLVVRGRVRSWMRRIERIIGMVMKLVLSSDGAIV